MPFDDDYKELNTPKAKEVKKELKISNPPKEKTAVPDFQQQAKEAFMKEEEMREKLLTLLPKFKNFFLDKTLKINKGPIADGIEQEVINQLINLATEINNDPQQKEGEGSNILILMLMKCMLIQRDQINDLRYSLAKLSKEENK